jgi:hypothetical protein
VLPVLFSIMAPRQFSFPLAQELQETTLFWTLCLPQPTHVLPVPYPGQVLDLPRSHCHLQRPGQRLLLACLQRSRIP